MNQAIRLIAAATALGALACGNGQKPARGGGGGGIADGSGAQVDAGPNGDLPAAANYTVLADGLYLPISLGADDSHVYWTVLGTEPNNQLDGEVHRVSTRGGSVETIAVDQTAPDELIVGDDHIYWANGSADTIMTWPKSGEEAAAVLSSKQAGASDLMIDDDYVYWVKGTIVKSAIVRHSHEAGTVATIHLIDEHPMVVASDRTTFYWATSLGDIWSVGKESKDPYTQLVVQSETDRTLVMAIATSERHVYWVVRGQLLEPDVIMRVGKLGGTAETVITARGDIGDLLIDGDTLYFSDSGMPRAADDDGPNQGRVMRAATSGGAPAVVASVDEREIAGMAIVGDRIYFADSGSLDFETGDWSANARVMSVDKNATARVSSP